MPVNNAGKGEVRVAEVKYLAGENEIRLTPGMVVKYIAAGNSRCTDQEVFMFMKLCEHQKLNPFLREAHLIKFGNQPATMVVGKDAFTKREQRNPKSKGHKAGVIVVTKDDQLEYREGALFVPGWDKRLVGGWADVFVDGYENPIHNEASFEEYVGKKKDGTVNSQWASKPATMIRKVALVQSLREAFPSDFEGMYIPEEMNVDAADVPTGEIKPDTLDGDDLVSEVSEDDEAALRELGVLDEAVTELSTEDEAILQDIGILDD